MARFSRLLRCAAPIALALAVLPALRAPGWAQAAAPPPLAGVCKGCSVILVSMGNVGAEHMSLYGYKRKTTPRLDAWAQDSLVFESAFTPASWTLPVGASLFTSLYPYTHGVWLRTEWNSLSKDIPTLPALLRAAGYRTAAFTGGLDYDPAFNYMGGFEAVGHNPPFTGFSKTIPEAARWLKGRPAGPFLLFLHGYDAHCPFVSDKPFLGTFSDPRGISPGIDFSRCIRGTSSKAYYKHRCVGENCGDSGPPSVRLAQKDIDYLAGRYDDSVLSEDALLGEFLASIDSATLATTIVVVTGDHGEMFAKHGRFGRAGTRWGTHYDDVIHVPLMIRIPGAGGRRVPGLVQSIDIMPTLLAMLGLKIPPSAQGKSLEPLIRRGAPVNEFVYSGMAYSLGPKDKSNRGLDLTETETVRNDHWKLIRELEFAPPPPGANPDSSPSDNRASLFASTGTPKSSALELYDIRADPEELHDLAKDQPAVTQEMLERLDAWADSARRAALHPASTSPVPKTLLDKARQRGYWE